MVPFWSPFVKLTHPILDPDSKLTLADFLLASPAGRLAGWRLLVLIERAAHCIDEY